MRPAIDQFMWGFQQHFRHSLEHTVERVLEELGRPGPSSTCFLVGFLQPGGVRHAICVEPEDGPLAPEDFEDVATRAKEIYAEDPESSIYHSVARVHERMHRLAMDRAIGAAIGEVIESRLSETAKCLVGMPTVVEEHLVYPVIALPAELEQSLPVLSRLSGDDPRQKVDRSIVHAAAAILLEEATRALHLPNPGEGAGIGVETEETRRLAAGRVVRSVVLLSGNMVSGSLAQAMNRLCTLRYEQRVGVGRLLLAQQGATEVNVDVRLAEPVSLRDSRTLRKLLELSGRAGPALLTDGEVVYGLGQLDASYDPSSERVFELAVVGDGSWELRHGSVTLFTADYGIPRLPEEPLGRREFEEAFRRVFEAASGFSVDTPWDLISAAAEAEHGTMIVISAAAAEEARRLRSQALAVEPTLLTSQMLRTATEIDGAVLIDPGGVCHGLGVILDGNADAEGDRARGARYNSAVKYLASASSPTVIVIVSEDGMINLLPDMPPRVARAQLDEAMADLHAAAAIEPVHPERFYKAFRRVRALKFYLSQQQCEDANRLRDNHWRRRRAAGASIWLTEEPLAPDPRMDDSYFSG